MVHKGENLFGVLVGKAQPAADLLGHSNTYIYMTVESNPVARYRCRLESGGLAHVMQKNAPCQRWCDPGGKSLQHEPGVNPYVAFWMVLRRLLDALHRGDFRQDLLEESRLFQQFECAAGSTFHKNFCKLFAQTLGRHLNNFRGMPADGVESIRLYFEAEPGGEAHGAQHTELLFREPAIRITDRANHFGLQVGLAPHVVEHFARVMPHQ